MPDAVKLILGRSLALCLTVVFCLPTTATADSASEYAVKAAIVFKIAKFVSWPDTGAASDNEPLSICLQETDPIGPAIDTLSGEIVHGRQIQVQRLNDVRTVARDCSILYMSRPSADQHAALLNRVSDAPVLTIGDTSNFTNSGGMISLQIQESRVRFAINVDASERAGLGISAQLLQLATIRN